MTTKKIPLEGCPVCSQPVSYAMVTTEGTMLTTQNLRQERTCLRPTTHDGEAASYIVYHEKIGRDEEDMDGPETTSDPEPEPEPEPPEDRPELEGKLEHLYNSIREETMDGGSVKQGTLQGKCMDVIDPNAMSSLLDQLEEMGYVTAIEKGVYKRVGE